MFDLAHSDELLIRLFKRHFKDASQALLRLDQHLKQLSLPFSLRAQLRELSFPTHREQPTGISSLIYYYVPDSGWGSINQPPTDPLAMDFVYGGDGIGLNLGCPVRLLRALDVLAQLSSQDQIEAKSGLSTSTKHLATIEELIWCMDWKSQSDLHRGGNIPGAKGDVDWKFKADGQQIYLEAKFRPSDWPRITDKGTYLPKSGTFLSKALHKFPNPPIKDSLQLVGIVAFANLNEEVLNLLAQELNGAPHIHGVVFRSLVRMTHVVARDFETRDKALSMLIAPSVRDFPTNYIVIFHRGQQEQRLEAQGRQVQTHQDKSRVTVVCAGLWPRFDSAEFVAPATPYHANIAGRKSDGEPEFEIIAP